jgi:excisionase family DNA binding protein
MREKLLTTREASQILGISEKEIIDFASSGLIPHFKIGGEFLRFRREDILKVKEEIRRKYNLSLKKYTWRDKIKDFFYFNDFYIVSFLIILILTWIIFKDILP